MKVKMQESDGWGGRQTPPFPGVQETAYWEEKKVKGHRSAALLAVTAGAGI